MAMLVRTLVLFVSACWSAQAQTLELQDGKSRIEFQVKNFGVTIKGSLKGLKGYFVWDEQNPALSKFEATVQTETIDTGIGLRDRHLRQDNYLNQALYPEIKLESDKIKKEEKNRWLAESVVTIKGIAKNVLIPFTVKNENSGFKFSGSFVINRLDFNVGGDSFSMANEVEISLEVVGAPAF